MSGPSTSARSSCSSDSTSISIVVPTGALARAAAIAAGDRISGPARLGGSLEPREVIVLDQDCIEQAEAVVMPSTAPDGVFFQGTPTGSGLTRVINRGLGACDRRHEPRRQGRDPAEPLKKVEGDALHRQQGTHRPVHSRDQAARLDETSVGEAWLPVVDELKLGDQALDGRACRPAPRQTAPPIARASGVAGNDRRRGNVAQLAQVFGKCLRDQHVNVTLLPLAESVLEFAHLTPASIRSQPVRYRGIATRQPSVHAYLFAFSSAFAASFH